MCTIKVLPLMDGLQYPDAGAALYNKMIPLIDTEDKIVLDLEGINLLPSMFLNVSIGRLIKEKGKSILAKISFNNITKTQIKRLQDYVDKIQ